MRWLCNQYQYKKNNYRGLFMTQLGVLIHMISELSHNFFISGVLILNFFFIIFLEFVRLYTIVVWVFCFCFFVF